MNFEIGDKVKTYLQDGSTFEGEVVAIRSGNNHPLDFEYGVKSILTNQIVGFYTGNDLDLINDSHNMSKWLPPVCDMGCDAVGAPRHVPTCSKHNWDEFYK